MFRFFLLASVRKLLNNEEKWVLHIQTFKLHYQRKNDALTEIILLTKTIIFMFILAQILYDIFSSAFVI